MKKFLLRFFFFVLILLCSVIICGIRIVKKDPADYLSAIIDKHNRLNSIPGPRIILVGGSNLAFGIDSKMLEKEFGIPVVNMGLHAGLGLDFMLKEVSNHIKPGDQIVISLEYFLSNEGEYQIKYKASEYFVPAKQYFKQSLMGDLKYLVERNKNAIIENLSYLRQKLPGSDQSILSSSENLNVYRRDCFDEYGDEICQLNGKSSIRASDIEAFSYKENEGIPLLNEFYKQALLKKAKVYFLYPNFPISVFKNNEKSIKQYQNEISVKLNIPVLNQPEDFIYNDSLFYDTVYHLNGAGRELRTKGVIKCLKGAGRGTRGGVPAFKNGDI